MAKYKVIEPLAVEDKVFEPNDEVELTDEQAQAAGSKVEPITAPRTEGV